MGKMTDQEIRKAILSIIDKNKILGHINTFKLSEDWGEDEKKIRSILNNLTEEGLIKSRIMSGIMPSATDFEITKKGRLYKDMDCNQRK